MDKTDAINIAQRYADAVKAKYNTIRIILFGSFAKGNFNEDSDIDIAVVFKDYSNLLDIQLELMRLRRNMIVGSNHIYLEKMNLIFLIQLLVRSLNTDKK